jgi:lipopolysaccharide export system permease protein
MRLLDRYLLRELLIPLGYCLVGFWIFWVAFDLFAELDELQDHKLRVLDVGHYYLIKAPEFLVIVLPIALLLALLYALTNHARHHEITAIRAAGIGLWRLSLPYLAVGLAASAVLFLMNEYWVPDSSERAEQLKARRAGAAPRHMIQNLGFTNARDGHTWQIANYNSQTGEMFQPQVIYAHPDGSRRWLTADRALRVRGVWTFYKAREFKESTKTNLVPSLQTNMIAMPQFSETREQIQSEINISKGLSLKARNKADIPIEQILDYLRLHPRPSRSDRFWLFTKLHGRLAEPWKCLVVVLIAIPFGAATGRRNVFVGVASSIVICFTYFLLQQFGLALGTGGHLPSWLAAWFPNIAFGGTGLWLTSQMR